MQLTHSIVLDIAECLAQQDELMLGLIVHVPTVPRWVPFWKGQHWFGVLRLSNGAFINLDSRLSQPVAFAGFDDVSDNENCTDGRFVFYHPSFFLLRLTLLFGIYCFRFLTPLPF